jgi:hypothetical protein
MNFLVITLLTCVSYASIITTAKMNAAAFGLRKRVIESKIENLRKPLRTSEHTASQIEEIMTSIFDCKTVPFVSPPTDQPAVVMAYTRFIRMILNPSGLDATEHKFLAVYTRENRLNPWVCALLREDHAGYAKLVDDIKNDGREYLDLLEKYTKWERESNHVAGLPNHDAGYSEIYARDYERPGTIVSDLTRTLRQIHSLMEKKTETHALWRSVLYETARKSGRPETMKRPFRYIPDSGFAHTVRGMVSHDSQSPEELLADMCQRFTTRSLEYTVMTIITEVFENPADDLKRRVVEIEGVILRGNSV